MPIEYISPSTTLETESEIQGRLVVDGYDSTIRIGKNVILQADILIYSEVRDARIEIGDGCVLAGEIRIVRGTGGVIRIGPKTTFNQVGLSLHESSAINIGADCMFSTEIWLDVSDMHPIYDRATGDRLNPPQDINIGDHVWLGARALVLKGARIGSGSIIGAGAMVAGTIPEHCLAIGSPARVARKNIVWTRDMDQEPELDPDSGREPEPPKRRLWFR